MKIETGVKKKKRLDVLVVERGLAESRQKALALILEARVLVGGRPATKAGASIPEDSDITLKGGGLARYASRGALKLEGAVSHFGVSLEGKTVMDVGASTGGFTDYMLQAGARKAYSVDVGAGQLHQRLRTDPRVVLLEKTNIRYLGRETVSDEIDLAAVDVSFISLRLVLPKVAEFLREGGEVLALVKPQFEVGRGEVEKGGVVRDEEKRLRAVGSVIEAARESGLETAGDVYESPVHGQKKGNIEYFIYLRKAADGR